MYFFRLSFTQNIVQFIGPFIIGTILHILYEKSKNIIVPILLHNVIDTLMYVMMAINNLFIFDYGGGSL